MVSDNPSLSARKKSARYQRAFCFLLERPGENPLSRSEEGFDKIVRNNFGRTTKGSTPAGQEPGWFLTIPLSPPERKAPAISGRFAFCWKGRVRTLCREAKKGSTNSPGANLDARSNAKCARRAKTRMVFVYPSPTGRQSEWLSVPAPRLVSTQLSRRYK